MTRRPQEAPAPARRRAGIALWTLTAMLAAGPLPAIDPPEKNLLIIVADDLGTDRLCPYREDCEDGGNPPPGVALTPTLNSMAASGVRFDEAWANPVCSTTRSTILTGQYSRRTGILAALGPGNVGLVPDDWTIPEMLQQAADCSPNPPPPGCPAGLDVERYETAAFGKWHLNGDAVQDPDGPGPLTGEAGPVFFGGFDYFEGTPANLGRRDNQENFCDYRWWTVQNQDGDITQDMGIDRSEYATSFTVDRAIHWLGDRLGSSRPWLLYLAFHAPHAPLHRVQVDGDTFTCGTPCNNPMDRETNVTCFLEMVGAMDAELGRLFGQLSAWEEAGQMDFPTVLFLGDNGTEPEVINLSIYPPVDGKPHGKTTVHQGGVRVPFLAFGDQAAALGANSSPVSSTDLFLTVAELAGATDLQAIRQLPGAADRQLDGFSFAPHLQLEGCGQAANPCRDNLFAEIESSGSQNCGPDCKPATNALAVRVAEHNSFKLIRGCLPCGDPQRTEQEELGCQQIDCAEGECFYNLELNPTEDRNILDRGTPPPDSAPGLALEALRQRLDFELTERLGCELDERGCPIDCGEE